MKRNPSITFVTCCENGLFGLRKIVEAGISVDRVITIPPVLGEKYKVSGYVDVSNFCVTHSIPVVSLQSYQLGVEDLDGRGSDILLVNGWNRLIDPQVIQMFEFGGLGIHAGHPPIGLGRAPLVWNIIKDFKEIEVYVFKLTERADDGDILALRPVEITPQDSVQTLYEKVMYVGAQLFLNVVSDLDGALVRAIKQNLDDAEVYPKRGELDGELNFSWSVDQVFNFIRAQSAPYPGAFSNLEGAVVKFWRAQPFDRFDTGNRVRCPGRILSILPSGIVVETGSSPIWITSATQGPTDLVKEMNKNPEKFIGKIFTSLGRQNTDAAT